MDFFSKKNHNRVNKLYQIYFASLSLSLCKLSYADVRHIDERSYQMGGTGVSSSLYIYAHMHNPALAALRSDTNQSFEQTVTAPIIQTQFNNQKLKESADKAVRYQKTYNKHVSNYGTFNLSAQKKYLKSVHALENKAKKSYTNESAFNTTIATVHKNQGSNLFLNVERENLTALDIKTGAIHYQGRTPNDILNLNDAQILSLNVTKVETGITYAQRYKNSPFYIGITPKVQSFSNQTCVSKLSKGAGCAETGSHPIQKYSHKETTVNGDVGILYKENKVRVGLVVKDIIAHTQKLKSDTVSADYKVHPQTVLGASYHEHRYTLSLDVELNKRKKFENIKGLMGSDHHLKDDTQFIGSGVEFKANKVVTLLMGYKYDLQKSRAPSATTGVQLKFDNFSIKSGVQYTNADQFGLSHQLIVKF